MLHLRISRGSKKAENLSLSDEELPFTIGRDQENKLQIEDTAVSRYHAVFFAENDKYFVQDIDSTNGTFVNGKKSKKSQLTPGDQITIGSVDILVEGSPATLHETHAPLDLSVSIENPIPTDATIEITNPTEEIAVEDFLEKTASYDLSRSYAALQILYKADKVLRNIEDFKNLLEQLMNLIMEVIPASRGYIFLLNRETKMPVPYVRRWPESLGEDTEIVVSKTILRTAVEKKESILSNDALVDERFIHSRSLANLNVRSAMCAPLLNRDKVLGIIYLDSTNKSHLFSKDDLALLSAIALKAGIALDNARLYDDMRNLFYNTVETLIRAIQAKDKYTSGHSTRVSRYALLIADQLHMSASDKHKLYLASMLHDIGKIGIPDELLNRPGKLNKEEVARVRDHVKVGASMIKTLGEMNPIVPLILHHHENWDGSGYPDGLKGEQIPLICRILSVADSYDAMTSDRPYRKARAKPEAITEIRRGSGKQYDPKVVEIFLAILGEERTQEEEPVEPEVANRTSNALT